MHSQDPFSFTEGKGTGVYAFLEAKPRTIAQCGWNSGWVKGAFIGGIVVGCTVVHVAR